MLPAWFSACLCLGIHLMTKYSPRRISQGVLLWATASTAVVRCLFVCFTVSNLQDVIKMMSKGQFTGYENVEIFLEDLYNASASSQNQNIYYISRPKLHTLCLSVCLLQESICCAKEQSTHITDIVNSPGLEKLLRIRKAPLICLYGSIISITFKSQLITQ